MTTGADPLPAEAAELFARDDFVAERNRIAKELRAAGRRDEAEAVAKLRKPPKLVVAINRAAVDLPVHAKAATVAAEKLARAQAAGDRRRAGEARQQLEKAADRLVERAAESGGDRSVLSQLVRAALTSPEAREELLAGRLAETPVASGFEALAGLEIAARRRAAPGGGPRPASPPRAERREAERRQALERELSAARAELRDAERAEASARRAREAASSRVEAIQGRLDRLGRDG